MMTPRALVRSLSAACLVTVLAVPAVQAQGLRPSSGGGLAVPDAGTLRAVEIKAQRQADFIVAIVNSDPITNNDVRARTVRLERQLEQQGVQMPPREQFARQVLDRLIAEKAQLQYAKEAGIKVDEILIDQAEQTVARQNQMSVPDLRRRLVTDGISQAQFRGELRDQLMLQRVRERELESRVKVGDADIDQYLQEQQASSNAANVELNLGHVLVAVPESASEAQVAALQARAQRVVERAKGGADFAALAQEFSDAPERASGGQLGLRPLDRYPQLFTDAVKDVAVGGVVGPVRSGAGFHVLKVLEKQQAGLPATTVTQSHARHILLRIGGRVTEASARERLADMRRRIQSGQADFAALAREFSQDGSARDGGDLGWASPGQFVPEFEDTMNALEPGQVSQPLVSRFGVHLIQLIERRQKTLSEREQRSLVQGAVREKKLDEAYDTWAREVRGRAYVELRDPPQL